MQFSTLKQRHREERQRYHPNLSLRVHRALSWLGKAERDVEQGDYDSAFVFYWIAFNAAYASDLSSVQASADKLCEAERFGDFVRKLCGLDRDNRLYEWVWHEFSDNIRLLLNNPYVFQPFWDVHSGRSPARDWQQEFQAANRAASRALGQKDTPAVVSITLSRIYTLRNQMIHGGATYASGVNREQVRTAKRFLQGFVPIIITLMMDNPDTLWGDACYPVVEVGDR
ncbi:HEPN domain-containing protein [Motiliproteus sediminis]|uniref:HEPN domain-containing protein n=1 Tax=Motiliproteus sediminis TaxID=1468178 RepID=UPI001AEF84C8|nr:HEPN domain-containing protein [Motiliproteus sediminis]